MKLVNCTESMPAETEVLEEPVAAGVVGKELPVVIRGLVASKANERRRQVGDIAFGKGVDSVDVRADQVAIGQGVDRDGDIGGCRAQRW